MSEQNDETQPVTETPPVAETSAAAPAGSTNNMPYSWATRAEGTTRRVENGPNTRSTWSCAMAGCSWCAR